MEEMNLIPVETCCTAYKIELSFVKSLGESGLVEVVESESQLFIAHEQLAMLERYMHLHYDLDINIEGLEAIHHLLGQLHDVQSRLQEVQSRLSLYE
ncbi:MAG: chaperone modulator CbpM [Niabella sp.]